MIYFPFDTQSCKLDFVMYHSEVNPIYVVPFGGQISFGEVSTSEWTFISAKSTNYTGSLVAELNDELAMMINNQSQHLEYDYPGFKYTITLKRHVTYYVFNLIIPVILLSIITQFSFVEFSGADIRITLGITVCS